MTAKIAAVLIALSQASAGLASGEFMLCFHQDGRVEVERFDLLCCRGSATASDGCCPEESGDAPASTCPDDQCQDLPVTLTSPRSSDRPAPAVEKFEGAFDGPLLLLLWTAFAPPVSAPVPSASLAGPPLRAGPLEQLRTIVLRI